MMVTIRRTLTLIGALVVALVVPAATAVAADAGDIRTLAAEAAEAVADEQAHLADGDVDALRAVDQRGHELLVELEARGVVLSLAARDSLALLPVSGAVATVAPPAVVYEAAADDLARIVDTPDAVVSAATTTSQELYVVGVVAIALLIVATVLGRRQTARAEQMRDDETTGLASRRQLDRDLAADDGTPTAVMVVDIDELERVNATLGREVGDVLLRRIGAILSSHVRQDDVVYRSGGSEFCVLLPGADHGDALAVAERVVGVVDELRLPDVATVTVSIGLATDRGTGVADTLFDAGRALGTARRAGGGRVATADSHQPA